jgi:hypothetical protein
MYWKYRSYSKDESAHTIPSATMRFSTLLPVICSIHAAFAILDISINTHALQGSLPDPLPFNILDLAGHTPGHASEGAAISAIAIATDSASITGAMFIEVFVDVPKPAHAAKRGTDGGA